MNKRIIKELHRLNIEKELFDTCMFYLYKFDCTFDLIEYAEERLRVSDIPCPF
jgi:hypothetical protein